MFPPIICVLNLAPKKIIKSAFCTAKFPCLVAATPKEPTFKGSDEEKWCKTAQLAVYGILLFFINLLLSSIESLNKHPLPTTINGLSDFFYYSIILL